jgi:hypothetical protein
MSDRHIAYVPTFPRDLLPQLGRMFLRNADNQTQQYKAPNLIGVLRVSVQRLNKLWPRKFEPSGTEDILSCCGNRVSLTCLHPSLYSSLFLHPPFSFRASSLLLPCPYLHTEFPQPGHSTPSRNQNSASEGTHRMYQISLLSLGRMSNNHRKDRWNFNGYWQKQSLIRWIVLEIHPH